MRKKIFHIISIVGIILILFSIGGTINLIPSKISLLLNTIGISLIFIGLLIKPKGIYPLKDIRDFFTKKTPS